MNERVLFVSYVDVISIASQHQISGCHHPFIVSSLVLCAWESLRCDQPIQCEDGYLVRVRLEACANSRIVLSAYLYGRLLGLCRTKPAVSIPPCRP